MENQYQENVEALRQWRDIAGSETLGTKSHTFLALRRFKGRSRTGRIYGGLTSSAGECEVFSGQED